MKISIIHPSRGRHVQAYETFQRWTSRADNSDNIDYILSLDEDACNEYYRQFFYDDHRIHMCLNKNRSAIDAINNAAKIAVGDLIIQIAEDFDCPEHWDTLLLKELEGRSDFIVKTQDGLQKTLITLPILDRTYYERFGYIYYNEYKHLWADNELTVVGHYLGKVITLPILFKHNHPITGAVKADAINHKNDLTWKQGEALFNARLKTNFGINKPLINYNDIKWR